jgi:general secretion pathway protein G
MQTRSCPACQTSFPADQPACPSCGVPAPGLAAKRGMPVWAWVVIGVCCAIPIFIVVIGMLAAVFVPRLAHTRVQAQASLAKVDIARIVSALDEFAIRNDGKYPATLQVLVVQDANGQRYLESDHVPTDPWGRAYLYEVPVPGAGDPHVWSYGPDGRPSEDDVDDRVRTAGGNLFASHAEDLIDQAARSLPGERVPPDAARDVDETCRAEITQIVYALNEYAIRNVGKYPETLEALVTPDSNGYRYLQMLRVPRDPWKREYRYEPPTPGSGEPDPHVWTYGKDGRPGGGDDIDSRTMDDH